MEKDKINIINNKNFKEKIVYFAIQTLKITTIMTIAMYACGYLQFKIPFIISDIFESNRSLRTKQNDVAHVVLITDNSDVKWPLPLKEFENLLIASYCYEANGVFIDINLSEYRSGNTELNNIDELSQLMYDLSKTTTSKKYNDYCIKKSNLDHKLNIYIAEPQYENAKIKLHDFVVPTNNYSKNIYKKYGSFKNKNGKHNSFAHKLYIDIFNNEINNKLNDLVISDSLFTPLNNIYINENCIKKFNIPKLGPLYYPSENALMNVINSNSTSNKFYWQECPIISYSDFDYYIAPGSSNDQFYQEIKGKYVIIGSGRSDANDYFDLDVNKNLPGSFIHAIAANELIGKNGARSTEDSIFTRIIAISLAGILFLVINYIICNNTDKKIIIFISYFLNLFSSTVILFNIYGLFNYTTFITVHDCIFFIVFYLGIDISMIEPIQLIVKLFEKTIEKISSHRN